MEFFMTGTRKSTGVIFPEPGRVVIDDVDIPAMGPEDVLVEIEHTSISNGTERWCLKGQLNLPDQPPMEFPHVPGYQAGGTVIETGPEVENIRKGDRVFSRNCRRPDGWKGSWWGGHIKHHVSDYKTVIKLPDDVSTYEASTLLLAQVGYNGASKPAVKPGVSAVVIGAGLLGQYASQVLCHRGAHVTIADISEERLEIANKYSDVEVFNCAGKDLAACMRDKYPDGVAIVLETASSSKTVRMAIDMLAYEGQLILNGFYPGTEGLIDWHWLRVKEITTYCPNSRTRARLEAALRLIQQGHLKVKELVTHEVGIKDASEAYSMLLDRSAKFLGIVFNWQ